jgi:hypothetical protein
MPVFVTQIEGDHLMLLEAETSGSFGKSDLEIRPNPMAAFDNSMDAMGQIGRIVAQRVQAQYAGTGIEKAEVTFGIKIDQAGAVMIAQESERSQFTVKLHVQTR